MIVLAFAAIFGLGWAVVHTIGPHLFFLLPRSLAYVLTLLGTIAVVYGLLVGLPDARRRRRRLTALKRST